MHPLPSHALNNVGRLPQVRFVPPKLITWLLIDFEDNNMSDPSDEIWTDSTICALVKQAIVLETNYKEMLHQGDEVDLRVKLWRDAIDICKSCSESMSFTFI
jgi:hypothetical protein